MGLCKPSSMIEQAKWSTVYEAKKNEFELVNWFYRRQSKIELLPIRAIMSIEIFHKHFYNAF